MKASRIVACVVVLTACVAAAAQAQSVPQAAAAPEALTCSPAPCVLPPTQASEGGNGVVNAPIATNPLNPRQILLGSADFNCPAETRVAVQVSNNGGSDWGHVCMTPLRTQQGTEYAGGQPMLGYDHNGVAYIAAGYGGNDTDGATAFQKSSDGANWSEPAVAIPGSKDASPFYGWLAVDASGKSPWVNSLYISSVFISEPFHRYNQVMVTHSHDGGATWKQAAVARIQTSPNIDQFTSVTVGRDGTVYVTWMYCNQGPSACGDHRAYMLFSKSTDGGNTWSPPKLVAAVTLLSTLLPNTNVGVTNYPAIGVDISNGAYAGHLYVVMYSWTGIYMRVQVVRSSDGGETWSKPVPVAPPSDTHDQFFPWLSVSPTGLVGVSWMDRRNDPANTKYQAFAAISKDGGKSFQQNVQLTTAFSDPNKNGNTWIGDYAGNTWAGPNTFVAAWMDNSNSFYMQDFVGGIRLK